MAKPKTGGRQKGTPNKVTGLLREAIVLAAEAHGYDGKGKDGVKGYCQYLAAKEPKAFAGLLGKVLPLQLTGEGDGPLQVNIAGDDTNLL